MSKYRKNAVFGKAVALGRSKDNAKVDTAIKMMRDELSKEESSSNPDRKAMEDAQYNLVKFTFARQDWLTVSLPLPTSTAKTRPIRRICRKSSICRVKPT